MKEVDYVLIEKIRPLEQVFPHHYLNLKEMIEKDGYMKYALVVEKEHNIVLDGSNRHLFLALNGYKYAPVHYVDYDNPHLRVGTNRIHRMFVDGKIDITKEEVIARGLSGDLFPPRTTRHFIPFLRPELCIPLKRLGKRKPLHKLADNIIKIEIKSEIEHNINYIEEIEIEVEEMIHYLEESVRTKKYLEKQIEEMKKCKR